jgi:hypothetical protein
MEVPMLRRIAYLLPLVAIACSHEKQDEPRAPAAAASRLQGAAEARLRGGGKWSFSLDDSPVAASATRDKCSTDVVPAACYARVREGAALEHIAFEVDAQGRLVWSSYGDDGTLLRRVPLDVVRAGADSVTVRTAAVDEGAQAPRIPAGTEMTIGVTAAGDVTMPHPAKGTLAFKPMR